MIYVGRATNLRTPRPRALPRRRGRKVPQLLLETEAIDWIECADELEASVREARLIREHDPRFNRQGKGWRGYAYLKLSTRERFPRLAVTRTLATTPRYLGPLTAPPARLRCAPRSRPRCRSALHDAHRPPTTDSDRCHRL